jgi:hypothetical protein
MPVRSVVSALQSVINRQYAFYEPAVAARKKAGVCVTELV